MSNLPKVYHSKINKKMNNNKNIYYSANKEKNEIIKSDKTVQQKINEIFSSPNYVYKANVEIVLKDKTINRRIIGRNKSYIITMDNELIKVEDIIDIYSKKIK